MLILCAMIVAPSITYGLTPKQEKWVITLRSPQIAHEAPEWISPYIDIAQAPTEIDYWKSLLPWEQYQDQELYIVLPTLWVVSPVAQVPEWTSDYNQMTQWQGIDINAYLTDGVMMYPWLGAVGEVWNAVIFGHSNFFRDGDGDFKTIFADIMNLDVGVRDEMRVYQRDANWVDYTRYRYEITKSYETSPQDVGILRHQWGKELTVFACTDWLAGRWILRGKLIEDEEVLIPHRMRIRVRELMDRLDVLSHEQQELITEEVGAMIAQVSDEQVAWLGEYEGKYREYVLRWMEWVLD